MGIYVITGNDTLTINNQILNDFADGDVSTFQFETDRVNVKTGKNGNTIFAQNQVGKNCKAVLRVMLGSSDDATLQGYLTASDQDFTSTVLLTGQFVKNLGDGSGNLVRDVYTLAGGIMTRYVDGKTNVEGETTQGVAVYNLVFASAVRSLQ